MEIDEAGPPSLGRVVGSNVRDLRVEGGLTQVEFTARCQRLGLSWHRPKISALESGGALTVSVSNLVVLAIALNAKPIDLLRGDGDVSLNPHFRCSLGELRELLSGEGAPDLLRDRRDGPTGSTASVVDVDPPLELELAKKFDVDVREIRYAATNSFAGRTVTEERDAQIAQLGPLTKEQRTTHRGHVMRRLSAAIEADLRRRNKMY